MTAAIIVPSRRRADLLRRTGPLMLDTGLPVYVTVEPADYRDYKASCPGGIHVVRMKRSNRGMAYARQVTVDLAEQEGYDQIVMANDSVLFPANTALLPESLGSGNAGMGAWFPINAHFSKLYAGTGIHATTGAPGLLLFCMNVMLVQEVGGFDLAFRRNREDSDLQFRLIRAGYGPWAINTDVQAATALKRMMPGGCESLPDAALRLREGAERFTLLYPGFSTMMPNGDNRVAWKKWYQACGYDWPLRWERMPSSADPQKVGDRRTPGGV